MNDEPVFGKKNLTNGEILSILIASVLIVGAFFMFINIYIVEVHGEDTQAIAFNPFEELQKPNQLQVRTEERESSLETTVQPTLEPTDRPTIVPTPEPTQSPAPKSTLEPTASPVPNPTIETTLTPSPTGTSVPTPAVTPIPTLIPTPAHTAESTPAQSAQKAVNEVPDSVRKIQQPRPYELLSKVPYSAGAIREFPRETSLCSVEGTISYSRFHIDLDRFFVSVRGIKEKVDAHGSFKLQTARTGVEELILGFDNDIILKSSVNLDSAEISKGFDIASIVPGLMRRRYDNAVTDKQLFEPIPEMAVNRGNEALKRVAITIDDGFSQDEKLLGLLKELGVQCTVFIIGGRNIANAHPEWIKEMDEMGFEVCNHTYTHPIITSLSDSALEKELRDTQRVISRVTNKSFPYFRPQGGAYDKRTLAVIARNGYILVNWSNSFGDTVKGNTTASQVKYVLDHLRNGDIILSHFGAVNTYEVMKQIVPEIRKRGYELVTVSEVLEGL